ncbi:MAG: hypothetical protein Q4B86_02175 [Eubacteriales bacterium]|nr:hypothetical protein [Eubacteriales bacterium]
MTDFLYIRDRIREIASEYGSAINAGLKFVLAFAVLFSIEKYIGYMPALNHMYIILPAAAICCFFPWGMISFMLTGFILANMFEVSASMTIMFFMISMLVFVLYFGFRPGNAVILALIPLGFLLKTPFVIPVILGFSLGMLSAIPASLGVLLWFFVKYFHNNYEILSKAGSQDLLGGLTAIVNGIFNDKYLYIVIVSFVLCILVVNIIRKMSMDNAFTISVLAGNAVLLVIMVAFGAIYSDTSLITDIIGIAVSIGISYIYVNTFYGLDYKKTERVQFEDDDYYYYVKAVPKLKTGDNSDNLR